MLKNNKAPGEDNTNAELIKISTPEILSSIHGIIKNSWENGIIPQEWKISIICPIYKKEDPMDTKNYRGIALLNTCYKIFSISVLHRLEKCTNDIIGNYQTGFIKGKSTTDHIFIIRQTLEKYYEFGKEIHICFVDFKQAYDSILREELWKALEEFRVPAKLIQLVKKCNSNSCYKVKFGKKISESFEASTRLR